MQNISSLKVIPGLKSQWCCTSLRDINLGRTTDGIEKRKNPSTWRDSNPQPLCHEACALWLCYNRCQLHTNIIWKGKGQLGSLHELCSGTLWGGEVCWSLRWVPHVVRDLVSSILIKTDLTVSDRFTWRNYGGSRKWTQDLLIKCQLSSPLDHQQGANTEMHSFVTRQIL